MISRKIFIQKNCSRFLRKSIRILFFILDEILQYHAWRNRQLLGISLKSLYEEISPSNVKPSRFIAPYIQLVIFLYLLCFLLLRYVLSAKYRCSNYTNVLLILLRLSWAQINIFFLFIHIVYKNIRNFLVALQTRSVSVLMFIEKWLQQQQQQQQYHCV